MRKARNQDRSAGQKRKERTKASKPEAQKRSAKGPRKAPGGRGFEGPRAAAEAQKQARQKRKERTKASRSTAGSRSKQQNKEKQKKVKQNKAQKKSTKEEAEKEPKQARQKRRSKALRFLLLRLTGVARPRKNEEGPRPWGRPFDFRFPGQLAHLFTQNYKKRYVFLENGLKYKKKRIKTL